MKGFYNILLSIKNDINIVGGSFQWPPRNDEDQGPTATPMYIDPQNPPTTGHQVGSLLGSDPVGASVRDLLGLDEKIVPTSGPLAQSAPSSQKPVQNGSAVPTYSVSRVTKSQVSV